MVFASLDEADGSTYRAVASTIEHSAGAKGVLSSARSTAQRLGGYRAAFGHRPVKRSDHRHVAQASIAHGHSSTALIHQQHTGVPHPERMASTPVQPRNTSFSTYGSRTVPATVKRMAAMSYGVRLVWPARWDATMKD